MFSQNFPSIKFFLLCIGLSFMLHCPANLEGANILVLSPSLSPSLLNHFGLIADILVEAGHNVTVWIPVMQPALGNGTKLAQQIIRMEGLTNAVTTISENDVFDEGANTFAIRLTLDGAMVEFCGSILKRKHELEILRQANFDLAFTNMIDLCFPGIVHFLGINKRHIWVSTGPIPDAYRWILGIPTPFSIVPSLQETALLGPKMSTWERAQNIWQYALSCYSILIRLMQENALFHEHISPQFPLLEEITGRTDLVFLNADQFLEPALPTLDKVISIGGLLQSNLSELSPDLLHAFESGPKGTIFCSLGSITDTRFLDPIKWQNLLRAFGHFSDYSFVIKINKGDERTPSFIAKMPNVHLFEWVPQHNLLAHPNVRLFITHSGQNSILESTIHGVPILAIPLFFDQNRNAKCAQHRRHARILTKNDLLDESKLREEIAEMLENESYKNAAFRLAKLFKEKPNRPRQNLLKWTEFVLSSGPLAELRPESVGMSLVEYFCLDIFFYSLLALATVIWLLWKGIKAILTAAFKKIWHQKKRTKRQIRRRKAD